MKKSKPTNKNEKKNNHLHFSDFPVLKINPNNYIDKIMRRIYLSFLILFICTTAYSQTSIITQKNDLLKNKIEEYSLLIKEANVYEAQTETELQKINYINIQAQLYFDSAKVISRKAEKDILNADIYIQKFNLYIDLFSSFLRKADHALTIANAFKDSTSVKNKQAADLCLNIQQDQPAYNSLNYNIDYVVQLGTGNINLNYFDKVEDVKVVKSIDGKNRFIVGFFDTKNEAIAYKDKMIELGFPDAFVFTTESLYTN